MNTPVLPLHLGQLLEQQKDRFADSLAYQYLDDEGQPGKAVTFQELFKRAADQARVLHHHTAPGDRVLIMTQTQLEFVEAFLACTLAGTTPVPVYTPKSVAAGPEMTFIRKIANDTDASAFITSVAQLAHLNAGDENREFLGSFQVITLEDLAASQSPRSLNLPLVTEEDAALILFTSGSTGDPKGVVLSHRNLMTNFCAFSACFRLSPETPICTWLPNFHIAGLYTRLVGLLSGSPTIVFAPHAFLNHPAVWLQTLSKHRIHMSAAPNFAYQLCANLPSSAYEESLDLSAWKMAISGGEVIQPATLTAFTQRYQPEGFQRESFLPYFGMTETLCTTIPQQESKRQPHFFSRRAIEAHSVEPTSESSNDSIGLISNGQLLADTRAVIVNPETLHQCGKGAIGELWLRGSSLTQGYWRREDLNQDLCQARLTPDDGHTYFRTGDLGFFKNEELFLTGRLKDLIIINGKNYYPTDIEETLKQTLNRDQALNIAAFSLTVDDRESLAIAIESPVPANASDWPAIIDTVRHSIREQHGLSLGGVIVLPPQSFPLTRSGKIRRSACRQKVQEGSWPIWNRASVSGRVASKTSNGPSASIADRLEFVFRAEISEMTDWAPSTTLDALGVDSIAAVRIATQIYHLWEYQVDYATFFSDTTLAQLANQIEQHQQGQGPSAPPPIEYHQDLSTLDTILKNSAKEQAATGAIFLTGATGFLGGYLLRDLLAMTDQPIVCLIRAKSISAARERLDATLENLGWHGIISPDRLRPICGSLDQPLFGLSSNHFNDLANQITQIIHNGANVNFVAPYSTLHRVNVASNLDILRLATTGSRKRIHYISTIGVFNGPDRDAFDPIRENDWIATPNRLFSGYSQSKWVAETLYRQAQERGHAVRTYRPGLVMGDSLTGYCHTEDFLCRFIKGCLQMGQFPDLELALDMTPVDHVSRTIIELLNQPDLDGKAFHILNHQGIPIPDLAQWFRSCGYQVDLTDSTNWHRQLAEGLPEDNALFPLAPFLLQRLPNSQQTILPFFSERGFNLDTANVNQALSRSAVSCPPVDHSLLACYTTYFQQIGFLAKPTVRPQTAAPIA